LSPRAVLAIARKDLIDAVRNLYILSALVLPLVLSLLFRVAFGGSSQAFSLTVVVHDPAGSRLVAALRQNPALNLVEVPSGDQLAAEVGRQAVAGLDVPPDFDAALAAGTRPKLTVLVNRGRGGAEVAGFDRVLERVVRNLAGQEMPFEEVLVSIGGSSAGSGISVVNIDAYLLIVLLVLALTMSGSFAVPTLLVEEKEKRTLDAVLVSPAGATDVVLGKGLVGLAYCAIEALVLLPMNNGLQGAWPLTVLTVLSASVFLVLVGLLMGGLFRTSGQVNTWSSLVMLVMILPTWLSFTDPSSPLSAALRLIPTRYVADALSITLAGNPDLGRLGLDLGIVLACSIAALVGVIWLLRREDR
jgi:ABC-2 type transport system permease protein